MNDRQFKLIVTLLSVIAALLLASFFPTIITFVGTVFFGALSIAVLIYYYLTNLKYENYRDFFVFLACLIPTYYIIRYASRKENKKLIIEHANKLFLKIEFEKALLKFNGNDYESITEIIDILKKASEIPSDEIETLIALSYLGLIYSSNYYGVHDIAKAIYYYEKAIEKGYKWANYKLGVIYFEEGKFINKSLAHQNFLSALKDYPSECSVFLGLLYKNGDVDSGLNWFKSWFSDSTLPNYKKAIHYFNKVIETDPIAQYHLGLMNYLGQGCEIDYKKAFNLLSKSAYSYTDSDVIHLAEMFFYGLGTEINYKESMIWAMVAKRCSYDNDDLLEKIQSKISTKEEADAYLFLANEFCYEDDTSQIDYLNKSYALGSADAAYELGNLYYSGSNTLIEKNLEKAFELLHSSALLGNSNSQRLLSNFYVNGEVVEKNYDEGIRLLTLSAEQNNTSALNLLAEYQRIEDKQISEESFKLFLKSADLGNAYACYVVGDVYANGFFVDGKYCESDITEKNIILAVKYLEIAAMKNIADAQLLLGTIYYYGYEPIEIDYKKSFSYFKSSLDNNNHYASKYLGLQNYFGLGVEVNSYFSTYYYQYFLKNNLKDGIVFHNLASNYLNGYGIDKNIMESLKLYESAARLGYKPSILALAFIYDEGKYTSKDMIKSLTWFYVASNLNFDEAFEHLKSLKDKLSSEGIEKAKSIADEITAEIKLIL